MTEIKKSLYDELSRVLTDYEEKEAGEAELYEMLCKIQNNWEDVITVE